MLRTLVGKAIDAGHAFRVTPDDLLDGVLPDIGDTRAKSSAFWVLLACSSVIAAAGVITNSTAVIIGAMVIAPLGTPIYGVAAALAFGHRITPAMLRLIGGIAVAIAIGALVNAITVERIDVVANPQVLSRTNPSLVDLGVAFATGLAGSLALVRSDVSPALPGVAIAISLVPPLSVVGITGAEGETTLAAGAMLLFATNMLAIILAGLLVFAGFRPAEAPGPRSTRRRRISLGLGSMVVVLLLAAGSAQSALLLREEQEVKDAASRFAQRHPEWVLRGVSRSGRKIEVTYLGRTQPDSNARAQIRHGIRSRLGSGEHADTEIVVRFETGTRFES